MNYEKVILVRYHSNSDYIGIDHRLLYIHIRKLQTFEKEGDKMKYTPGPWEAIVDDNQPQIFHKAIIALLENNGKRKVTVVQEHGRTVTEEEQIPNAELIAAAPELLEISKKLLKKFNNYEEVIGTIEEVAETVDELRKIIINWRLATHELHSK